MLSTEVDYTASRAKGTSCTISTVRSPVYPLHPRSARPRHSHVMGPNDVLGVTVTALLPPLGVVSTLVLGGATVAPVVAAEVVTGRDGVCRTSLGGAGPPGGACATHQRPRRRAAAATAAVTRAMMGYVVKRSLSLGRSLRSCALSAGAEVTRVRDGALDGRCR